MQTQRVSFHVLWAACALLALRPVPVADRYVEEVLAPTRLLSYLARPFAFVGGPAARAGETASDAATAESQGRLIAEELIAAGLPQDRSLWEGRSRVPARVLARTPRNRDEIVVVPWTTVGVEVGMPVATGDAYVGRVTKVDREQNRLVVRLVTAPDAFVGARVVPLGSLQGGSAADGNTVGGNIASGNIADGSATRAVRFVVGGVALARRAAGVEARLLLAARNPSVPGTSVRGELVVDELLPELDPYWALARGFRLGRISESSTEGDWRVEPLVDFLHGLFEVVVVTPIAGPKVEPPVHPIADEFWTSARPVSVADASPWRASLVLALDRSVPIGAAVVRGGRLLGRVTASTRLGADAQQLADPGLGFPVAGVPIGTDDARPRVLGRVVALGLDPATQLPRFHLRDAVPFEVDGVAEGAVVRVRMITGSGESGLPAGLLVGDAEFTTGSSDGRGKTFVLLDPPAPVDGADVLWVRGAEVLR